MLKKLFVIIFIGSIGANFFLVYVLDKALFFRKHVHHMEENFINQGVHLRTIEELSRTGIKPAGVFVGGSFVKFWHLPYDLPLVISNQGGLEEKISTDYMKIQENILGSGIDFLFINSGFCEIHTAVNAGKDVNIVIDQNFNYLKQMVQKSLSGDIVPVITTLPPVRPVFIFAYMKFFSIPSEKKIKENNAIQRYNQKLRDYALDNKIYLVDFEKVLADEKGCLKKDFSVTDGEHLDIEGYLYLNRVFRQELEKILVGS